MASSSVDPGDAAVPTVTESAGPVAAIDLEAVRRRLVRLATKLLWNRDDAEEIVQDAFETALRSGPRQTEAHFEPWLVRTVGFLALNRRRKKRPEALADWMDVPTRTTPLDGAVRSGELERLRGAIDELPEQQRLALILRMMEQLDYDRIAEIMQTSGSAARANVHLARRRLVKLLAPTAEAEA